VEYHGIISPVWQSPLMPQKARNQQFLAILTAMHLERFDGGKSKKQIESLKLPLWSVIDFICRCDLLRVAHQ
jgi:hypothetical protein